MDCDKHRSKLGIHRVVRKLSALFIEGYPGRSPIITRHEDFRDRVHPTPSVLIGLNLSEFRRLAPFPTPPFSPSNAIAPDGSEKVPRKSASDRFAFFSPTVVRLPAQGLLMIVSFGTDQSHAIFFAFYPLSHWPYDRNDFRSSSGFPRPRPRR